MKQILGFVIGFLATLAISAGVTHAMPVVFTFEPHEDYFVACAVLSIAVAFFGGIAGMVTAVKD